MSEIPNYPSNAHFEASKASVDKPRTECVIADKKTNRPMRFLDVFVAKDVTEIKEYLIYDLIIPKIKETIQDTIDMMFWGGTRNSRSRYTSGGARIYRQTDYSSISTHNAQRSRGEEPLRASRRSDIVEYKAMTLAEAQHACDDLKWNCERYGKARLEEYYQLIGLPTISTDHNWGWTNLADLQPRREGINSWIVPVPNPEQLTN